MGRIVRQYQIDLAEIPISISLSQVIDQLLETRCEVGAFSTRAHDLVRPLGVAYPCFLVSAPSNLLLD
jgi:hypothetical protein